MVYGEALDGVLFWRTNNLGTYVLGIGSRSSEYVVLMFDE